MHPPLEEDLYASHYIGVVRRNWPIVAGGAALGALVGVALILFVLPRQYRAVTSVLFETEATAALPLPTGVPGVQSVAAKLGLGQQGSTASNMAVAFAESMKVRLEVIERLDLVEAWGAAGVFDAEERLKKTVSVLLTDKGTMVIMVSASGSPRGVLPRNTDDLAQRTLARDIANEYVRIIDRHLSTLLLTRSQRKAEFLKGRVAEARQELDAARAALKTRQVELRVVTPPSSAPPPEVETLAAFERQRVTAEAEAHAARGELGRLKEQLDAEEQMVLSNVVSQRSAMADRLKENIAEATAELAALHEKGYSDETPECRQLLARVEAIERAYADEVDEGLRTQAQTMSSNPVRETLLETVAKLEGNRAAAEAQAAALAGEVARVTGRLEQLPGAMEQIGALAQEVEVRTTLYGVVTNAYEMAKVEAAEEAPQFTVLDEAVIPPRKIAPSGLQTCVALAVVGLVAGLLAAPGWERRRRKNPPAPSE